MTPFQMTSKAQHQEAIAKIKKTISSFSAFQEKEVQVEINQTQDGQFLIEVDTPSKKCAISHGWGDKKWNFENPGVIDIFLHDKSSGESYAIYMTECELDDFPSLLENAQVVILRFLKNEYKITKLKKFTFLKNTYMQFDGQNLIYKYATKVKRGKTQA